MYLDDIRGVLAIRDGGISLCATVRDLLDAQIAELDATVAELLGLKQGAGARDGCRRWQRTGAIPRRTAPDADGCGMRRLGGRRDEPGRCGQGRDGGPTVMPSPLHRLPVKRGAASAGPSGCPRVKGTSIHFGSGGVATKCVDMTMLAQQSVDVLQHVLHDVRFGRAPPALMVRTCTRHAPDPTSRRTDAGRAPSVKGNGSCPWRHCSTAWRDPAW
ncbi:hypothetical protein [Streptomyces mirabilis]|uniref:hypothetical protein n=1 Tax=Streptomyces mirabilis TaxID=68239 RepID=UPI00338EF37F